MWRRSVHLKVIGTKRMFVCDHAFGIFDGYRASNKLRRGRDAENFDDTSIKNNATSRNYALLG